MPGVVEAISAFAVIVSIVSLVVASTANRKSELARQEALDLWRDSRGDALRQAVALNLLEACREINATVAEILIERESYRGLAAAGNYGEAHNLVKEKFKRLTSLRAKWFAILPLSFMTEMDRLKPIFDNWSTALKDDFRSGDQKWSSRFSVAMDEVRAKLIGQAREFARVDQLVESTTPEQLGSKRAIEKLGAENRRAGHLHWSGYVHN